MGKTNANGSHTSTAFATRLPPSTSRRGLVQPPHIVVVCPVEVHARMTVMTNTNLRQFRVRFGFV